jgi:hypothetical protein
MKDNAEGKQIKHPCFRYPSLKGCFPGDCGRGQVCRIRTSWENCLHGGDLISTFNRLAETWKYDTACHSSINIIANHSAYQEIIKMGSEVVPLILQEMQRQPGHWFWALHAITGEDPAPKGSTVREATQAWLDWGKKQGLL